MKKSVDFCLPQNKMDKVCKNAIYLDGRFCVRTKFLLFSVNNDEIECAAQACAPGFPGTEEWINKYDLNILAASKQQFPYRTEPVNFRTILIIFKLV